MAGLAGEPDMDKVPVVGERCKVCLALQQEGVSCLVLMERDLREMVQKQEEDVDGAPPLENNSRIGGRALAVGVCNARICRTIMVPCAVTAREGGEAE